MAISKPRSKFNSINPTKTGDQEHEKSLGIRCDDGLTLHTQHRKPGSLNSVSDYRRVIQVIHEVQHVPRAPSGTDMTKPPLYGVAPETPNSKLIKTRKART